MAYQFAYNPTNEQIPVHSFMKGSHGADIGGIIGYLEPQEQCCIIDYTGYSPYYQIGFFRGGSRYGVNNGYTTGACIGDYRVMSADPYNPMHATGFRTGKANGERKGYWTFNVRNICGVYKRIGSSFYMYHLSLYPGDKIGLVNGRVYSGMHKGSSRAAQWNTSLLGIDTFWIADGGRVGGDSGGFPWQDQDSYDNDYYVDLGHNIGRTAGNKSNIITVEFQD